MYKKFILYWMYKMEKELNNVEKEEQTMNIKTLTPQKTMNALSNQMCDGLQNLLFEVKSWQLKSMDHVFHFFICINKMYALLWLICNDLWKTEDFFWLEWLHIWMLCITCRHACMYSTRTLLFLYHTKCEYDYDQLKTFLSHAF